MKGYRKEQQEWFKRCYGVDAAIGARVRFQGMPGTIISYRGNYLGLRLDDRVKPVTVHPTWRMEYLP